MTTFPSIACAPTDPLAAPPPAKAALRKALLARRRQFDGAARAGWDARIGALVDAWWRAAGDGVLGVYWPLAGEPDLSAAYAALAASGARLALPVVLERDAPLQFADWRPGEALRPDRAGVAVPADLRLGAAPAALLVPCLGFNPARLRLGYGGGFYDRTLARPPRPATLGVAYAGLAADFAGEAHDVALDRIVTEAGFI